MVERDSSVTTHPRSPEARRANPRSRDDLHAGEWTVSTERQTPVAEPTGEGSVDYAPQITVVGRARRTERKRVKAQKRRQ